MSYIVRLHMFIYLLFIIKLVQEVHNNNDNDEIIIIIVILIINDNKSIVKLNDKNSSKRQNRRNAKQQIFNCTNLRNSILATADPPVHE